MVPRTLHGGYSRQRLTLPSVAALAAACSQALRVPWFLGPPRAHGVECSLLFVHSPLVPQDVLISSPQLSLFSHRGWATTVGQWGQGPPPRKGLLPFQASDLKLPQSLGFHLTLWALSLLITVQRSHAQKPLSTPSSHREAVLCPGQECRLWGLPP